MIKLRNIRKGICLAAVLLILGLSSNSYAGEMTYEQHVLKGREYTKANNLPEAIAEFRGALRERPDDREATLYLAVVLNSSGDKEAESMLKRALFMDPTDPRTNLELGICYYNKATYDEAADYFENTINLAPGTEFSAKAERYLGLIRQKTGIKKWSVLVNAGGQYDSNVILNAAGSPLPQGISGKADWKATLSLKGRYDIPGGEKADASVGYSLYQSLHSKLSDFNISQHILDLSGGYSISPSLALRGSYSFEYVYVGGQGYNYAHSFVPSLVISEGSGFTALLEYKYKKSNFIDSEQFKDNSERTGSNNSIGITQYIPLGKSVVGSLGYFYDKDSTDKDYWNYTGNRVTAGLLSRISSNMLIDLSGEYYDKAYKGVSPGEQAARLDRTYTASISATRTFSEKYSVTLGYYYTDNRSNIAIYGYDRSITSLFLNVRF